MACGKAAMQRFNGDLKQRAPLYEQNDLKQFDSKMARIKLKQKCMRRRAHVQASGLIRRVQAKLKNLHALYIAGYI